MENHLHKINRIKKLQYRYGESNMHCKEIVSPSYKSKIDKKYKDKQDIFIIDGVLTNLDNNVRKMIKKEVYQICNTFRLKDLCYNCKIEVIIAIIALYVWKTRHSSLREDQTRIWRVYELTYKKYALVLGKLLQKTRETSVVSL